MNRNEKKKIAKGVFETHPFDEVHVNNHGHAFSNLNDALGSVEGEDKASQIDSFTRDEMKLKAVKDDDTSSNENNSASSNDDGENESGNEEDKKVDYSLMNKEKLQQLCTDRNLKFGEKDFKKDLIALLELDDEQKASASSTTE